MMIYLSKDGRRMLIPHDNKFSEFLRDEEEHVVIMVIL